MLNIKAEVMMEELNDTNVKRGSAQAAIKTKEHSLNQLSDEK